eukprot:gene2162-biopygen9485
MLPQPVTVEWLDKLSLSVFDGDFSCCSIGHRGTDACDKEALMPAMLGLYTRVPCDNRADTSPGVPFVRADAFVCITYPSAQNAPERVNGGPLAVWRAPSKVTAQRLLCCMDWRPQYKEMGRGHFG